MRGIRCIVHVALSQSDTQSDEILQLSLGNASRVVVFVERRCARTPEGTPWRRSYLLGRARAVYYKQGKGCSPPRRADSLSEHPPAYRPVVQFLFGRGSSVLPRGSFLFDTRSYARRHGRRDLGAGASADAPRPRHFGGVEPRRHAAGYRGRRPRRSVGRFYGCVTFPDSSQVLLSSSLFSPRPPHPSLTGAARANACCLRVHAESSLSPYDFPPQPPAAPGATDCTCSICLLYFKPFASGTTQVNTVTLHRRDHMI